MAEKVTFDTANKLIICKPGVTALNIRIDIYSDTKEDWLSTPALNKYRFPMKVIGGMDTAPGEVAPLYCYLYNGWRLRPDEANHTLKLTDGALLVYEDTTIDPVVDTVGYFNVRVNSYVPTQASLLAPGLLVDVKKMMYNDAHKDGNLVTIKNDDGTTWKVFDITNGRIRVQ